MHHFGYFIFYKELVQKTLPATVYTLNKGIGVLVSSACLSNCLGPFEGDAVFQAVSASCHNK